MVPATYTLPKASVVSDVAESMADEPKLLHRQLRAGRIVFGNEGIRSAGVDAADRAVGNTGDEVVTSSVDGGGVPGLQNVLLYWRCSVTVPARLRTENSTSLPPAGASHRTGDKGRRNQSSRVLAAAALHVVQSALFLARSRSVQRADLPEYVIAAASG